jgi:MFS family permease
MSANATPTLTAAGLPYDARRARELLIVLAGMALMVTYVETMVLPAFNQFYTFFRLSGTASFGVVAWILSAYLLVGTVVVPIFGKLGDLYGKKRMLLIAMSVYAVAVTLAGFTPNIGSLLSISRPNQIYLLIAVRGIQGIGMGMFPLAFAMIPEAFPASRVAQGQSVVGAMFAAGAALGLAGGGWIAQSYGWQVTYHTVVPVAFVLLILGYFLLRESPVHGNPVLDIPGVTSLGFGLATLLIGVTEGAYWGWTSLSAVTYGGIPWGVPEFFLLSVLGFAFFAYWEPRAKSPVIRFEALKPRNIFVSNVNGILVGALMFFAFTTAVILAELPIGPGLGVSEFTFGLLALPSALSMLACAPLIGYGVSRLGPKPVTLLGYGLMAFGGFMLLEFNRTTFELSLFMIPLLVGNVAALISMSNMIVLSVDRRELGVQTGMNQTFRNLGTAIAPVVTTSVLASFTATYFVHGFPVSSYSLTGFQTVFGIVLALALAGFFLSLSLRNYRFSADGTRQGHAEGASPAASPAAEPVATPSATSAH